MLLPFKSSLLAESSQLTTRTTPEYIFQFFADSIGADHEIDHNY
jgi:hypothetical protein